MKNRHLIYKIGKINVISINGKLAGAIIMYAEQVSDKMRLFLEEKAKISPYRNLTRIIAMCAAKESGLRLTTAFAPFKKQSGNGFADRDEFLCF